MQKLGMDMPITIIGNKVNLSALVFVLFCHVVCLGTEHPSVSLVLCVCLV